MANKKPKTEHLTTFADMPKQELKEIAAKGGKAKAEVEQKRKTLREQLMVLLETSTGGNSTNNELISVALISRALNGDVRAFEVIRDTIGEKPANKIEASVDNSPPPKIVLEVVKGNRGVDNAKTTGSI